LTQALLLVPMSDSAVWGRLLNNAAVFKSFQTCEFPMLGSLLFQTSYENNPLSLEGQQSWSWFLREGPLTFFRLSIHFPKKSLGISVFTSKKCCNKANPWNLLQVTCFLRVGPKTIWAELLDPSVVETHSFLHDRCQLW
jgi:hypothetical protein